MLIQLKNKDTLIYDDFKERLIEDMVFGKITINEYGNTERYI